MVAECLSKPVCSGLFYCFNSQEQNDSTLQLFNDPLYYRKNDADNFISCSKQNQSFRDWTYFSRIYLCYAKANCPIFDNNKDKMIVFLPPQLAHQISVGNQTFSINLDFHWNGELIFSLYDINRNSSSSNISSQMNDYFANEIQFNMYQSAPESWDIYINYSDSLALLPELSVSGTSTNISSFDSGFFVQVVPLDMSKFEQMNSSSYQQANSLTRSSKCKNDMPILYFELIACCL